MSPQKSLAQVFSVGALEIRVISPLRDARRRHLNFGERDELTGWRDLKIHTKLRAHSQAHIDSLTDCSFPLC